MWLFGSMGDLFESIIKRDFEAKDSAKLIPGLGGVFDQLDSVLLAGPAAYLMLTGLSF
jgi:phosphatidate cytidylyltransferase